MTLEDAVRTKRACDPLDCDCDTCPIGKKMAFDAHDAGVDIVFTVCGVLAGIDDCLEDEDTFLYRHEQ